MVRILGYSSSADTDSEEPREITRTPSSSGDNGWLIRFFDSAFFCEWIAVSYLFKHEHAGVRDYLCNRMYSLPITGIENYLFQLCSMTLSKPLASLDKYIVDICTQSLKIAVKVHWFLVAEAEDLIDNDGIFRLQEKCQMAVLTGDWPPLIKHQKAVTSPSGKSRMFKLLSSRRLLPLTSPQKSSMSSTGEEGFRESSATVKCTAEESESSLKVFKKLMPGPKVRDAIFKKFRDKEEDDGEQPKEGEQESFFHRLFREKDDEERAVRSEELATTESFFRRLFRDKTDSEDRTASRVSEDEVKGLVFLFRKLFREKHDDRDKIDDEEKTNGSWDEDEAPEFFLFRKFLRVHPEDEGKTSPSIFDSATFGTPENSPETDGFFKRLFKDRPLDRKEDRSSPSSFLKRLFKERIEDVSLSEDAVNSENCEVDCSSENSRSSRLRSRNGYHGTDDSADSTSQQHQLERLPSAKLNFEDIPTESGSAPVREEEKPTPATPSEKPSAISAAHKFFTSSDWSLLSNGKSSAKRPGSPKQRTQRGCSKPPLPRYSSFHIRKGSYYATLDFFKSLCEIASGLVDVFPVEDRRKALHESLTELNNHLKSAENDGGVCFPMGKGICRVVHIPEEEAILMSSREKAPYLVCFEVLKCENKSSDKDKDAVANKLPRGIPLANGDAHLQRPPPWAYPIWNQYDAHQTGSEHYLRTASQAIDRAMSHDWETNVKFVELSMSTQEEGEDDDEVDGGRRGNSVVRVNLRALVDLNMEDVEEEFPPRRKDHRRVPSTIAMAEVRAAAAKGEAPLGLPLKTSGTEPDEVEKNAKATDALAGEIWGFKRERIRNSSAFGALPGWDLRSAIVKSGDDCRQEHLAVQLVAHFYDIFQEAGLPLWLRPYEVLVTSSRAALIETIPDTASIHAIKSRNLNLCSLREFFCKKYDENSPGFKLAQRNFVESMAGYSILCYVLQVKDRHNGNLLIDEDGHVIHIDFGFMLSNSPGGVNFENVPFKLTRELLEVMDSDAEGTASEFFDYFKVLCIQGFLTCRKHAERIILLVEMMQDSGCPCFKGGAKTMQNLRKRFHLNLTEEQCVSLVLSLISNSLDAWRTRQYDYYQRVLNGIL